MTLDGWKLVPVEATPEMLLAGESVTNHNRVGWYDADIARAEYRAMLAAAPAVPQAEPCIGNDPTCPCQDGDACHYKDAADGTKGWPVPQAEPKREPLREEGVVATLVREGVNKHKAREIVAWIKQHGIGGSDAE